MRNRLLSNTHQILLYLMGMTDYLPNFHSLYVYILYDHHPIMTMAEIHLHAFIGYYFLLSKLSRLSKHKLLDRVTSSNSIYPM